MSVLFKNRAEAGQKLANELIKFRDENPVILALPRGGVPVGYEVARKLRVPLDVLLVRKIGVPMSPELAAGAIVDGEDPQLILNDEIVKLYNIPASYIETRRIQQLAEIERRRKIYCPDHPPVNIEGKTAIIVDDGIATGATIRAAIKGIQKRNPKKLVLAVPVCAPGIIETLRKEADEIICLSTPRPFLAIGEFYSDFTQLDDERVAAFLVQAGQWRKEMVENQN